MSSRNLVNLPTTSFGRSSVRSRMETDSEEVSAKAAVPPAAGDGSSSVVTDAGVRHNNPRTTTSPLTDNENKNTHIVGSRRKHDPDGTNAQSRTRTTVKTKGKRSFFFWAGKERKNGSIIASRSSSSSHNTNHHHHHHYNHRQNGPKSSSSLSEGAAADNHTLSTQHYLNSEREEEHALVQRETRTINILRVAVFLLLVITATAVCISVYKLARHEEVLLYEQSHEANALRVLDSFHLAVQQKLAAIEALGTDITSIAETKQRLFSDSPSSDQSSRPDNETTAAFFPFVTIPHFEIKGAALRVQADAVIIHWTPLVRDDQRDEWEKYADENMNQIFDAFDSDQAYRTQQDETYGYNGTSRDAGNGNVSRNRERSLQEPQNGTALSPSNVTQTSTKYNYRIWSNGAINPRGPEANGTGPYLPLWQRSPINNAKEGLLNLNFASTKAVEGVLPVILEGQVAVMNRAITPLPEFVETFKANLAISQYRHDSDGIVEDPLTFISYPVFDSFDLITRQVAGVLHTNIYWKLFFTDILNEAAMPTLCVLRNSFNQTLSYLIEGPKVTFLGQEDFHNPEFDRLGYHSNVNHHIRQSAGPATRSYTAVPISQDFGVYTLSVYPADDPQHTNNPWIYATAIALTLLFVSTIYVCFTIQVEQRQRKMMDRAIGNARKAAAAERELNEFLSHEVRNPLSAAIAACTFVDAALEEQENERHKNKQRQHRLLPSEVMSDGGGNDFDTLASTTTATACSCVSFDHCIQEENSAITYHTLRDDVRIINSSLHFVNDFLRSMLDIHRAAANKLELKMAPVDIRKDVLDPVFNMLYQRDVNVQMIVDCPDNLIVLTDSLRLKQVILNLGRNSTKFVEKGFIRMRSEVVDGCVELYVEDSGSGIPMSKRPELFSKYQSSLDVISQGTGFGLSLCKSLMTILEGDIWLDDTYDSGIEGCPGARFVVRLNSMPLSLSQFDSSRSIGNESHHSISVNVPIGQSSSNEGNIEGMQKNNNGRRNTCDADPASIVSKELPTNLNVLFVDDDMLLRKLFARAVKKVAPLWNIEEAASGESAIHLVEKRKRVDDGSSEDCLAEGEDVFDLIFMDMYMASTEKQLLGTETIRALRSKDVQSIIVGLSANDLGENFMASGADSFLLKPIPCKPNDLRLELLKIIARGEHRHEMPKD